MFYGEVTSLKGSVGGHLGILCIEVILKDGYGY